ncbi:hypothetical protein PCANB_001363 [Pneumocystis canis]|nr:hypothetical protein PCANB_001363 [Pneumocystis canis]
MNEKIRILSLNCWGLKYISNYRKERLDFISERIASEDYHVVGLQEVWVYSDYENLRNKTKHKLPYGKFYFSGIFGSGLVILSKFPIQSTSMYRYSLNGKPSAFYHGDWYVGKGVAIATLLMPNGKKLEFFNTHLHASYEKDKDSYLCHRISQAWEISKLISSAFAAGKIIIIVGDFNSTPDSIIFKIISFNVSISDSWNINLDQNQCVEKPLNQKKIIEKLCLTCDSPINTWRMKKWKKYPEKCEAKRLDYILIDTSWFKVKCVKLAFTETIPSLDCSYSDHFGIDAIIELMNNPTNSDPGKLKIEDLEIVQQEFNNYINRVKKSSYFRTVYFFISLIVIIGLHISIFWSHNIYITFSLFLINTVILSTSIFTSLYGFIFGWWELRTLSEFQEEISLLNNGCYIPALGLGTWQSKPNEVAKAVEMALKAGYRHIGITKNLIVLLVINKIGHSLYVPKRRRNLYLMHWPIALNPNGNHFLFPKKSDGTLDQEEGWDFLKTWGLLENLVSTGKVKAIGVSNFSTLNLEKLLKIAKIIPAVNQCELHPYLPQDKLVEFCNEKGIHLTAYSPLGSTDAPLLKEPLILEIAEKNKKTAAQVVLSWCIQRGTSVIPKSVTPSRIISNLQVFELSEEDFSSLNALGKIHKHRYINPLSWNFVFHDD